MIRAHDGERAWKASSFQPSPNEYSYPESPLFFFCVAVKLSTNDGIFKWGIDVRYKVYVSKAGDPNEAQKGIIRGTNEGQLNANRSK